MNFAKIVSFVTLIVFEAQSKLDEASFSALQDLYQSTNGENWIQNDNWTFADQNITANNICPDNRPFGIGCLCINSCENDTFIVSQIQLPNNNLVGTIPSSIFNFFSIFYAILVVPLKLPEYGKQQFNWQYPEYIIRQ